MLNSKSHRVKIASPGPTGYRLYKIVRVIFCAVFLMSSFALLAGAQPISARPVISGASFLALQTPTPPAQLQRRTAPTDMTNNRGVECQRQHAQWEANLPSRSLITGAIFYIILISLFTLIGFSSPFVRAFCALVGALILGPAVVGLQKHESLKVCPNSTSFWGILTADLFVWTLGGVVILMFLLLLIRYMSAVRKLNRQQAA